MQLVLLCTACKSEQAEVLSGANAYDSDLCCTAAALVQVLPYFMFYRGAQGKLEEFSASSKRIHLIQ
jgi:hypothetical protein